MSVDGSDVGDRMRLVADRIEFIDLLSDRHLRTRDIVDGLEHSRSTVTRVLRDLRDADLVRKDEEGYTATVAGVMMAEQYRGYETASEAILAAKDLLDPVPVADAPPAELLVDADTIRSEADVPIRPLEAIADRVRGADAIRIYLPTLINTHLLRVWHHAVVSDGVDSEAGFAPGLLEVLKGQYPRLLSEMAATDGFSAFSGTGLPYGLVLARADGEVTASVIVYEDETTVSGVITNDSDAAVQWARAAFERVRDDSSEVTADLEALSAAVGDGPIVPVEGSTRTPTSERGHGEHAGGRGLPLELETEGFVRLSEAYFDAHSQAPPEVSWRTGFTLTEVRAGHAVDRMDDEGRNLTGSLVDTLRSGDDHVLLGPPGAGKSTICMAVACAWNERDYGPVLYRERGGGDDFESTAMLEAYLRRTDGHALVVVEDVVREQASAVFEVIQALDSTDGVTFLLDARTQEWRDADGIYIDARRDAYRRSAIEQVNVPELDERECQRFVDHFSSLVDDDVDLTGPELFSLVEAGAGRDGISAGGALIAQYYLSRRYDPIAENDRRPPTALDETVRRTLRSFADHETRCVLDVAVLASVLNVAGVPVATEYLYAIATEEEYAEVDAALSLLEGRMLFQSDQRAAGGSSPTTYRTRHETWSIRFLQEFHEYVPTRQARERFGRCVTRLLSLADDSARRDRIRRHLGGRTPHLHRIEVDPTNWADEVLERVYGVGTTASNLAPLFAETADRTIRLPEACSEWMAVRTAYWSGRMNRIHGDFSRAEREFQRTRERAESIETPSEGVQMPAVTRSGRDRGGRSERDAGTDEASRICWRALSFAELGEIARERGEFALAVERFEEALALFRDIDDPYGEASVIKHLGNVAYKRGDIPGAEERYEESLAVFRDLNDSHGEAMILTNLGAVAHGRGDLQTAREFYHESIDRYRELGDRHREATALRNLGMVARQRDELEAATRHLAESLTICRDIGDRHGEAVALSNLGVVAHQRGELSAAADHLETSLALFREIGDRQDEAHTLEYLGEVRREQGDTEAARRHLNECLEICREIGDRHSEATSLLKLGSIASESDEPERAVSYLEEAAEISIEINFSEAPETLRKLIDVYEQQGRTEAAADWCRRAADFGEETDRTELKDELEARRAELMEQGRSD